MKLRNKKTGEIMDDAQYRNYSISDGFGFRMGDKEWEYHSLAELNEDWEDYKPAEPLIKDEKIRKAVRAWAEACNIERCAYDGDGKFSTRWHGITLDGSGEELEEGSYTVAELCGEGEE